MIRRDNLQIGEHDLLEVLDQVSLNVNAFIELPDAARDRRGGYFTVVSRNTESPQVITITKIGNPALEESNTYFDFSQEKANRLIVSIELSSSFQNRDPDNGRWGGAIKTSDYVLSFSGLPELGDEAVMLLTAYSFSWLTEEQIVKIAKISSNPHVAPLFRKLYSRPIRGL